MPMAGDYLRRAVAEFVGVFALVFAGVGSIAYARTLTDVALAQGFVLAAMISAVGFISGGHFNPAVTLGFVVTRRIALPLAFAVIATAAILALVFAGDYVTDWIDPLQLGPIVLSLFGVAATNCVIQYVIASGVEMRRVSTKPNVIAGLKWPPEMKPNAETKTAITRPCASATSVRVRAKATEPAPTKISANVPMNSAVPRRK